MIETISQRRLYGDEVEVIVSVHNPTKSTQEVRATLFTNGNAQVDKEPDFFFKNVAPGQSTQLKLSTAWTTKAEARDLQPSYVIRTESQSGEISDAVIVDYSSGRFQHVSNAAVQMAASQIQEAQGAQQKTNVEAESSAVGTLFKSNALSLDQPAGGVASYIFPLIVIAVVVAVAIMVAKRK